MVYGFRDKYHCRLCLLCCPRWSFCVFAFLCICIFVHLYSCNFFFMMDSITVGSNPDESVGHRNLVQVRVLPVEEVGVRPPDPREELQRFEEKPIEL